MKKAQVTLFIVMGIVIIFIFFLVTWYNLASEREKTDPSKTQTSLLDFENSYNSFNTYIQSCFGLLIRDSIESVGFDKELIEQSLKLKAIECFEGELYETLEIEIDPSLQINLNEDERTYHVNLIIDVKLSKENLEKSINEFYFSFSKDTLEIISDYKIEIDENEFGIIGLDENKGSLVNDEIIVKFNKEPPESFEEGLNIIKREKIYEEDLDLTGLSPTLINTINKITLDEKITFDANKISYDDLKEKLLALDFVEEVSQNKIIPSNAYFPIRLFVKKEEPFVNDQFSKYQWYLKNDGNIFGTPGADINIEPAWTITEGNMIISVIDQGVFSNSDMNIDYDYSYNFVGDNYNINPTSYDEYHGTHVAGVISSKKDNYQGIAGVCPDCSVINMKVMDAFTGTDTMTLVNAVIKSIANGAEIISMSLGGTHYSSYEEKIFNVFADEGIIFIAAAGNDGTSEKNYPAAYSGVIAVGATNPNDELASFSNYGSWIDITAPGENILSACNNIEYCFLSGTSMATPIISGVIGLMKSTKQDLTLSEIKSILRNTGETVSNSYKKVDAGSALEYLIYSFQ